MKNIYGTDKKLELILWSIAFPGFGQLLNRKYVKGFIFVVLEVIINVKGNINGIIIHSFLGEIDEAIASANYLWVLFYPCIYLFAMWDAYKDAGVTRPFSYLPFVLSAYLGTLGVIYSSKLRLFDYLIGPVFLPIIMMTIGALIGKWIQKRIMKKAK